ncbi:sensor histidine kinase [Nocardia puris]|nr:nitrate- and nitrite sensing domain-containing protein [Nocardia puris]
MRSGPRPSGVATGPSGRAGFVGGLVRPRTIRGRLARILAVSLAVVFALLAVTAAAQVRAYQRAGAAAESVSLALAVQDVLHEAQRERGLSNGMLGGDAGLAGAVADQRGATDRALRALDGESSSGAPGSDQVRAAVGRLAALPAVRAQIDERRLGRQAAFQFYTDAIDTLNHLRLGLDHADDAAVCRGLLALSALGEAKEQTARERGFLNGVFAAGGFGPGEYVQFLDIRAAKTIALAAFTRDATPAHRDLLAAALAGENATRAAESERVAVDSAAGPLVRPVDPGDWWARMTAVIDEQRVVQQAVGDAVRDRADDLRDRAALVLLIFALAALAAVAAEVALVVASMRAIVRPLAELADVADDVASRRLPEVIAAWHADPETTPDRPAPVRTPPGASVEIEAVAGALDRVQDTAYALASEQALLRRNSTESMANLARRNQNLVRRQLGLISEFEREELDPKALSNLFELDHLATRMRRNAESLLVLVGEGSPRSWAAPIALTDVIRAGLSEVDDYRRVVLRRVDEVAIAGAAVSELAHILAELIENGLAFSPPDLEVEIYGRKTADGYLLAVVDHGIGMAEDQLAEANARLRGERDFLVAPTRYLGHYVVGRLARRLGVEVVLAVAPVSGIAARLRLPAALLGGETPAAVAPTASSAVAAHVTGETRALAAGPVRALEGGETPRTATNSAPVPRATNSSELSPWFRSATPAPASPPAATPTEPERTRNGLVKRTRGSRPARPASTPARPPAAPPVERSPEEVRGMLAAFRAGHQRGGPRTENTTPDGDLARSSADH